MLHTSVDLQYELITPTDGTKRPRPCGTKPKKPGCFISSTPIQRTAELSPVVLSPGACEARGSIVQRLAAEGLMSETLMRQVYWLEADATFGAALLDA